MADEECRQCRGKEAGRPTYLETVPLPPLPPSAPPPPSSLQLLASIVRRYARTRPPPRPRPPTHSPRRPRASRSKSERGNDTRGCDEEDDDAAGAAAAGLLAFDAGVPLAGAVHGRVVSRRVVAARAGLGAGGAGDVRGARADRVALCAGGICLVRVCGAALRACTLCVRACACGGARVLCERDVVGVCTPLGFTLSSVEEPVFPFFFASPAVVWKRGGSVKASVCVRAVARACVTCLCVRAA